MRYNIKGFIYRTVRALERIEPEKRHFLLERACKLVKAFPKYEQSQAVKAWSAFFPESVINIRLGEKDDNAGGDVSQITEFVAGYTISYDEVTKRLNIEKDGKTHTVEELLYEAELNGFKRHTRTVMKLLNPENKNITVVKTYNSLDLYLRSLSDNYKGEKVIQQLCNYIKVHDFCDNPEKNFYQARANRLIHKWLVKCAGQALGLTTNDVMLLWIDPVGGAGKSYFNTWLFSMPEMKPYYLAIREYKSFMPFDDYSRSVIGLDLDEFPLSRSRYLSFKSHIAAEDGKAYSKKTGQNHSYKRIMSMIGSTNKGNRNNQRGFLLDDDDAMKRRILAVEVDKFDYKRYLKNIDLEQLWGQAVSEAVEYFENQKLTISWEGDWSDFRAYNSRYVNEDLNFESLLLSKIQKAGKEDGIFMTSGEIARHISNVKISAEAVGKKLSKLGFVRARNRNDRGWWVKLS